jgi:tetratricopeptide (TPR) repeat protein
MTNKTPEQIVKEYRLKFALTVVLYILAVAGLIFLMSINLIIPMIGIVFLAYFIRTPFEKLREKYIESVLYEELDPEKFEKILSLGVGKKNARYKMLVYMAKGNHDAILEGVAKEEEKARHPVDKCNCLYRKGYVYFERGEYDKLIDVFKKYEKLKADNPRFVYILNNFSVFEKFDAFSDEDYEYVVDVCDIDLKELNPKKQNHKLTKINVSFYRAVSLYKLGKYEEAKQGFEDIISFAPNMYKAKLSRDFLELINKQ